jgi:PhnB protein
MSKSAKPIPEGFHTLTPSLVVKGGRDAIEFYKNVFGAEVIAIMPGPDGQSVMHGELKIGDSHLFVNDEFPDMGVKSPKSLGGTASSVHVYVPDVDAVFERAVKAGATVRMPVSDMFWGDRYGKLCDPFGHDWAIATRVEELTPEQIKERGEAFFKQMASSRK